MNLLEKKCWIYEYPWGNIINPDTVNEICINPELVRFQDGKAVHFGCSNAPCSGWKMDMNWQVVRTKTQWSVGAIIAKEEFRTHFGTYHFAFRVPNFRGAWPAIWLIDLHPAPPKGDGMGIPPEIDVFEHFRKDGFLTRFHISHAFHQGPSYENNTVLSKKSWKLLPLDLHDIDLAFTWLPSGMAWTVNGKNIMTVSPDTPNYPSKPMNLIMNTGLGLDWKPNAGRFEDFVIKNAEYHPVSLANKA